MGDMSSEKMTGGWNGRREERPVRVLLFTDSDAFAGTERHMLDLARGLRGAGAEAGIACPGASPLAVRAREEGIKVVPIEKRGFVDWNAVWILRKRLRAGELEVIHAHNGRTALAATLAVKLSARGRCVLTQHFLEPTRALRRGPKALLSKAMHRWISRSAGHTVAISEAVRAGICERGEAAGDKITVVPNGIATPVAEKLTPPGEMRAALGIAAEAQLIVCAARLEQEKDVRSLVAAMPGIVAAAPDAVCVIAGEGSQRAALEAQIGALGLAGSIRLLGFREDALSLIQAADIFVLPSLAEPFGLVLIEAMALGRPVIATRAGGPREIVEENVTGLLIPPGDPAALARAMQLLLKDKVLRIGMGQRGHERFEERFTAARMAQETLLIYRKVCDEFNQPNQGVARTAL